MGRFGTLSWHKLAHIVLRGDKRKSVQKCQKKKPLQSLCDLSETERDQNVTSQNKE